MLQFLIISFLLSFVVVNRTANFHAEPNRTLWSKNKVRPNRTRTELLDFKFGRTELFGRKLAELFGRTEPNFYNMKIVQIFCKLYLFQLIMTFLAYIMLRNLDRCMNFKKIQLSCKKKIFWVKIWKYLTDFANKIKVRFSSVWPNFRVRVRPNRTHF